MMIVTSMRFQHVLLIGLIAAAALAADKPSQITPESVRDSYMTFARITKEPKPVGTQFAILCGNSTPAMNAAKKETGPHL
jgi:hypothetical protein